jgi:predicted unusual protein kinase regulating ubiquinone biosynthesis (AarF/ABC1/UbiB family)
MAGKRDRLRAITTSWAGRTLASGKVAASLGRAAMSSVAGLGVDGEGLGERVADNLDAMKGLAMKVGQMVSYLDGSLPPDAQRVLRRLQQGGEPLDFEIIAPILEEALGAPIADLFDRIDPEPIAAASIGQVHRGSLHGREVAIKVQYPGVAGTFATDLATFRRVGALATFGTALSISDLAQELHDRLAEECDYPREARVQQLFHTLYSDDDTLIVPEVHHDRVAPMVLTTSFCEGLDFYAFVERSTQDQRNEAARKLFTFAFRNIFRHGMLHGDPHPGNTLFRDDGAVVFLDYGCDFVPTWKRLARCILEGRRQDLAECTMATGFVPHEDRYDWDAHWDVMNYLYEPFLTSNFHYTQEYVTRSYDLMSMKSPNWRRTAMPKPWLLTNRLQWGLNSILAMLDAEGDFATLYRELLDDELVPATLPAAPSETP